MNHYTSDIGRVQNKLNMLLFRVRPKPTLIIPLLRSPVTPRHFFGSKLKTVYDSSSEQVTFGIMIHYHTLCKYSSISYVPYVVLFYVISKMFCRVARASSTPPPNAVYVSSTLIFCPHILPWAPITNRKSRQLN